MRVADEDTWEQEFWKDIIDEFGPEGYVEMRYLSQVKAIEPEEVPQWTREAGNERPVTDTEETVVPNAA
jgi:hypothetical protein